MRIADLFRGAREFFVGRPSFSQAMKLGGVSADRALDGFERLLGPTIRQEGEKSLGTFERSYLTARESGNDESRRKYVTRCLPLLPPREQVRAKRRLGIDDRGNVQEGYAALQGDLAAGGQQAADALQHLEEQHGAEIRAGGKDGTNVFWDLHSLVKMAGNSETTGAYRRQFMRMLPEPERAAVGSEVSEIVANEILFPSRMRDKGSS